MSKRSVPWPCPACKPLFCSMECTNPECGNYREVESLGETLATVTAGPGHSVEFAGKKFYLDTIDVDLGRGPEKALCFLFIDKAWVVRAIAAFQAGPGKDETWVKDRAGKWHQTILHNPVLLKHSPKITVEGGSGLFVRQGGGIWIVNIWPNGAVHCWLGTSGQCEGPALD